MTLKEKIDRLLLEIENEMEKAVKNGAEVHLVNGHVEIDGVCVYGVDYNSPGVVSSFQGYLKTYLSGYGREQRIAKLRKQLKELEEV